MLVGDVVCELGSTVDLLAFVLPGADASRVNLAEGSSLSADAVGSYPVRFDCDGTEQTAVLTVVDTTAPAVLFRDVTCSYTELPAAEAFVAEFSDLSPCTVGFVTEPDIRSDSVTVYEEDAYGNRTEGTAALEVTGYFNTVTLEYGSFLTAGDIAANEKRDGAAFSEELLFALTVSEVIDTGEPVSGVSAEDDPDAGYNDDAAAVETVKINVYREPGSYAVVLTRNTEGLWELTSLETIPEAGTEADAADAPEASPETEVPTELGEEALCFTLIIQDSMPPEVTFINPSLDILSAVSPEDFIERDTLRDASGIGELTLEGEYDMTKTGEYPVTVTVSDVLGNTVSADLILTVTPDSTGPVFYGLTTITLGKHAEAPDYEEGVSAIDAVSGRRTFTLSAAGVNYDSAGTYYVRYSSTDGAGNTTDSYRKVIINHDAADTAALVARWSAAAGSTPTAIKHYVTSHIEYNHDYGGDDPIWFGITNKRGNCYVHAKVLQALLTSAGYSNKLIWTTDRTHYWNMVFYNGQWWHLDSTNGYNGELDLMTDAVRYSRLRGRDWDRSLWPASGSSGTNPGADPDPLPGETPDPGTDPAPGETPDPGTDPAPGETPDPGTDPAPGETPDPGTDPAPGETPGSGPDPAPGENPAPGTDPAPGGSGTAETP